MPNRIDELLAARAMGYQDLADAIERQTGIETTRQTMWRLATGRRKLNDQWIGRIARALDVPQGELLPGPPRGLAESEGRFLTGNELSEIEREQARVLYPEGRAETMIMQGRALLFAGYCSGDRLLVDLKRKPQPGDPVVLQVYDAAGEAQTQFRIYQPPLLLPASAEPQYRLYHLERDEVTVMGVIVGTYRAPRFAEVAA